MFFPLWIRYKLSHWKKLPFFRRVTQSKLVQYIYKKNGGKEPEIKYTNDEFS